MKLRTSIVKSNIYYYISRIVLLILAFVTSIVLARLLQPYEFGLYTFAISFAMLLGVFTDFGLIRTMVTFVPNYISKNQLGKAKNVLLIITKYKIISILAVGIFACVFSDQIASFVYNKPEVSQMVFLGGILLLGSTLFSYGSNILRSFKDFKANSFADGMQTALQLILTVGFILFGFKAAGAVAGYILSLFIMLLYLIHHIFKKHKEVVYAKKQPVNIGVMKAFAFWALIAYIVSAVDIVVDKTMISIFLPIQFVGFYGVASSWSIALLSLIPISHYVLTPYFSSKFSKEILSKMLEKTIRYTVILSVPCAFALALFSNSLVKILYGISYAETIPVMWLLALASIPFIMISILDTFFYGIKRPDIRGKSCILFIIANIALNYFIIQIYGIVGVAIVTLLLTFLQFLFYYIMTIRLGYLKFRISQLLKPVIASSITYYILSYLPEATAIIFLCLYGILFVGVYALFLFLVKGFTSNDIKYFKETLYGLKK